MIFKKLLSYFVDIPLDKASTPLNPVLELSLRKGRYYLTTTNAVYSHGDLYENFLKTFRTIDFSSHQFKEVLVLGFGLGSVPYMLERVFHQKFNCTGVEADAQIAAWANQHILPTMENSVHLHLGDALEYVENCRQQFDLVVVDLFLDDTVPTQFEEMSFLLQLKKLTADDGLVLFNRLADTPAALTTTKKFCEQKFLRVFPEASYLQVSGNWVLASRKVWA